MMEKEKYQPIACQFYDVLELHASRKKTVNISYFTSSQEVKTVHSVISTLVTKNKEEFLVLPDGTEIRLDQIIGIDDIQFYGSCGM